jgi:hypothetical protein
MSLRSQKEKQEEEQDINQVAEKWIEEWGEAREWCCCIFMCVFVTSARVKTTK